VDVVELSVGDATLVRVPYADVLVDADVVGLTAEQVAASSAANPVWAEGDQVRVGAAVWIIQSEGRRIVVDPTQAADEILRTGPDASFHQQAVGDALATAGFPRESIDTVVVSHVDGIGMVAWLEDNQWSPFFPNAEVLISQREYEAIADDGPYDPQGSEALLALAAQGVVQQVDDEHEVTSEVATEWTGGHSPGHLLVNVTDGGTTATMIGHLALSPLHLALGDPGRHPDPARAAAAMERIHDGRVLVGPLWPAPGAARWYDDGVLVASS
jgi:glyoxylase-like metal-dependent hydrolase (beta-lactamase superfamily II)